MATPQAHVVFDDELSVRVAMAAPAAAAGLDAAAFEENITLKFTGIFVDLSEMKVSR